MQLSAQYLVGPDEDDDDRQDRGQEDLARLEARLGAGDVDAGAPHQLVLALVVVVEDVLATDPAQDPQPRHGVGGLSGQSTGRFALGGLGTVQGTHQGNRQESEHRNTHQDDEPELERGEQQDEGHDEPGHDRSDESGERVEGAPHAHRVGHHGIDHVAGGDLVGQGLPGGGDVASDEVTGAKGGVHPVGDGELVAQGAAYRLEDPEHHDQSHPLGEGSRIVMHDAGVDGAPDGGPDQRLRHHPADAEDGVPRQVADLAPREPGEVALGRVPRRRAGVLVGELSVRQVRHEYPSTLKCWRTGARSLGGVPLTVEEVVIRLGG